MAAQFKCTKDNLKTLFQDGGLRQYYNKIPKTIMDAIAFVRSIKESYIWIDALCIIQDDDKHKAEQIFHMATIYGNSLLTIIAASSDNADSGISGIAGRGRKLDTYPVPMHPGLYCAKRKDFLSEFFETRHSSRGWTFQERLISRRCLYLLGSQSYFQCRSATWSEDRFSSSKKGLELLNPMIKMTDKMYKSDSIFFAHYFQMVNEYLDKDLTDPSDIVKAFAGISELLGASRGWNFVHCLPEQMIHTALLWSSVDRRAQRRTTLGANEMTLEPSWSWTGWKGRITYEWTTLWGGQLKPLMREISKEKSKLGPATFLRFVANMAELLYFSVESIC